MHLVWIFPKSIFRLSTHSRLYLDRGMNVDQSAKNRRVDQLFSSITRDSKEQLFDNPSLKNLMNILLLKIEITYMGFCQKVVQVLKCFVNILNSCVTKTCQCAIWRGRVKKTSKNYLEA